LQSRGLHQRWNWPFPGKSFATSQLPEQPDHLESNVLSDGGETMASDETSAGAARAANFKLGDLQQVVAVVAAILGVFATYQSTRNSGRLGEIESRLSTQREERNWAKELYTQFDAIVSKDADEEARVDRLAGLLALTELTDQPRVKSQLKRLISQQAARYEAALAAKSSPENPKTAVQLAQYVQLQATAGATNSRSVGVGARAVVRERARKAGDPAQATKTRPSRPVPADSTARIQKWLWPGLKSFDKAGIPRDANGNEVNVSSAGVAALRSELSRLGLQGMPIGTFLVTDSLTAERNKAIRDLQIP
jgi:hypothetical protein